MSIRQYIHLIALVEAGSYRRAAENLNISHSALVHSIKALEEDHEIRLFDRGRGVRAIPTKIGELFIRHVRQILKDEKDLHLEIQRAKETGTEPLNITFAPFPLKMSGQKAVNQMVLRYPKMHVKSSIRQYKQAMEMVVDRKTDVAIAEHSYSNYYPELDIEPLGQHVAGFFCRHDHPLLKREYLTIKDVIEFPWCCTRLPSRVKQYLPSELKQAGHVDPITQEVVPTVDVETMFGLKPMINDSDVLFLTGLTMLKDELIAGDLALLQFHAPWMVTNYGFITLKNRMLSPVVSEFMDEIRRIEKELFLEERELVENFFECATAR